jgi:mRNA-degrading endonuclease RelE of RelBE toxin-antitoxin system
MKIEFTNDFKYELGDLIHFISRDKPKAARKFKTDLIKNLQKDLKNPFHFKKSIYFDDDNYRDYVFKGYTTVFMVNEIQETVFVLGILKHRNTF